MRPEVLTIQNFGPFRKIEGVDFSALDDIFLVTGKTGSGKTTIFDALCFALYGAVPGSRQGHLSRLRSDFAVEGEECLVSLEFSIGEKRYRIDRSPRHEKPKKRGTGTTTVEESAELYEIAGGTLVKLNIRKSEADDMIRELLGLSKEEFFKIVLLPQGEFAEFLKQNTTDRQKVLGKLFPVDWAVRIQELVRERAREGEAELREAERALGEIAKRIDFATAGALREQAEEAIRQAKARLQALGEEADRFKGFQQLRRQEQEAAQRLAELTGELNRLNAREGEIRQQEGRLARSRQAAPLAQRLRWEETQKQEADTAGLAMERARQERRVAEEAAAEAENRAVGIAELEREAQLLREKRPRFIELAAEEETYRCTLTEAETLAKRLGNLEKEMDSLGIRRTSLEGELQAMEAKAQGFETLDARFEEVKGVMELLVRLKKIAEEGEALGKERKTLEDRIASLDQAKAELDNRIPIHEAELTRLRQEQETHERADQAAYLGTALRPGEPCPVCGSRDHPLPAAAAPPLFGIRERIEAQERALQAALRDQAAGETERHGREEEFRKIEAKLLTLGKETAEIRAGFSSPEAQDAPRLGAFFAQKDAPVDRGECAALLEAQVARLNALSRERSETQRAGSRLTELHREFNELQKRLGAAEKDHAALGEKRHALMETGETLGRKVETLAAEFIQLQESWGGKLAKSSRLGDMARALDQRIRSAETAIEAYREDRERTGQDLAAAHARETSGQQALEEAIRRYQEAAAELSAALETSPFASAAEVREAILDGDAEAAVEGEITRWKESRSRMGSLEEEARRNREKIAQDLTALGEVPPMEAIDSRLRALAGELEAAEAERDQAHGKRAALERDELLLKEATERYGALKDRSRQLSALADDLTGKNPKKKPFDAWLLGRHLEEIAAYATARLEKMSESRYSLLLQSDGEGGRGKAGLDLAVFDAYTGKCRPCATLSGGESFMASISLALGLADSIQNRSGGIRLDAVFIDEGFGSLDDASLDRALIILDELREHRMVGLISHVGELRSRIPSHIEVIKSGSGSRITMGK